MVQVVDNAANVGLSTLGEDDASYTLVEGISFNEAMDIRAEGMTFKSQWTVEVKAVRS